MNEPNTPNSMLERSPEPFAEVWVFPEGWDLSEMENKPVNASQAGPESQAAEPLLFLPFKLTV